MSAPSADFPALGASTSSSGYTDGLGRRALAFDREDGTMLERLVVRAELSAFERSLRDRVERIAAMDDERLAKPRSIERSHEGSLVVLSEFVPGSRLSDLLDSTVQDGTVPGVDVALGYLLDVLPALCGLHAGAGFAHGAIGPGRTVLTPAGQVVLLDGIFGDALSRLQYSRRRLWAEFGIAMPPAAGPPRLDASADIAQVALCAVMLVVGRPIADYEYPDAIPSLLVEVVDVAQIRGSTEFAAGVQRFLQRSLPIPGRRPYTAADDALIDARELARTIGVEVCRRALVEFIEQQNSSGQVEETVETDEYAAIYADAYGTDDTVTGAANGDGDLEVYAEEEDEEDIGEEVDLDLDGPAAAREDTREDTIYDLSQGADPTLGEEPPASLEEVSVEPAADEPAAEEYTAASAQEDLPAAVDVDSFREQTFAEPAPEPEPEPEPAVEPEPAPELAAWPLDAFEPAAAIEPAADIEPAAPIYQAEEALPEIPPYSPAEEPPHTAPATEEAPETASWEDTPERASWEAAETAPAQDAEQFADSTTEEAEPQSTAALDDEAGEETRGGRRRKRSRSARSRKDKLRSTARPEPPAPVPPPAPAPSLAKPASGGWLVEPSRAVAFEPPVPMHSAPADPFLVPPEPPPMPVALAPPPPPPIPVAPPPPPVARPVMVAPPQAPPIQLHRPVPVAPPPPSAVKLKTEAPAGYAPPRRPRADAIEDSYSHHVPPPAAGGPSEFPWKLASAALVIMVVAVVAGRAYLPGGSTPPPKPQVEEAAPAPAPAAAPAVVPKTGRIQIDTQPPGARILLDGKHVGESPLNLEVPAGRHTLTLAATSGSIRRTVRVEAGKTVTIDAPIFSGWVDVVAPIILDVSEDGKSIGTTEQSRLLLRPGRHELTFSNRDLDYSSSHTVDIEPGEVKTLTLDPRGSANLNASPWAEVWIAGKKVGETPLANLQLPLGTHEVVFKHPQFGERRITTTIRANAPVALSVDMSKQ